MNIHVVIPLASFIAYCGLLALIVLRGRTRTGRHYAYFLIWVATWSGSSFVLRANFFPEYALLWGKALFFAAEGMTIAYYHFVLSFQNKRPNILLYIGYCLLPVLLAAAVFGYFPRSVSVQDGILIMDRGPLVYVMGLMCTSFVALSIISLVKQYKRLRDPLARTRTSYLIVGIGTIVCFALLNVSEDLANYSIDHIGNLINAFLTTYAILRYRLLEISLFIRRSLAYSVVTLSMTALYFFLLFALQSLFQGEQTLHRLVAAVFVALLGAGLFEPLTHHAREFVDRLFLGESYAYRQSLAKFSSNMGHVLNLEELAQAMLALTTRAVGATQASLLLPQNGRFLSQFAYRKGGAEPLVGMKLDRENPIVTWLAREGKPVLRETLDIAPDFKALWQAEKRDIDAVDYELLFPLTTNDNLVGILALGRKERGDPYSSEDIDLLTNVASEVAILVDNAQRHTAIKVEVNTDGLTGLFNHRFFQERINEEIRRSSRLGVAFSVILLDLDLFKTYNDAYGHQAGDAVLKEVAECITSSMRRVDLAFRYGGDEFAIMLPETTSGDAYKVAERIRKTLEAQMDTLGVLLSASVGVATWPTDAVMRKELIQCADAAMYYAKKTGMNRTRLFSQVPIVTPQAWEQGWGPSETLSMVYALAATVDAKDHFTYGHSKKVSRYAVAIGEALGFGEAEIAILRNSGLLHDIGKIGVTDATLRKPGPLNEQEWAQIKGHPEVAVAILRHVGPLKDCLPAILHHHERFDGSGYPLGLKGEDIPLEARILGVADAYDAMTSQRPYRDALTPQQALDELARGAGSQFDPRIAKVCVALGESLLTWREETTLETVPSA